MHILTLTTLFPNSQQPVFAVFIKNRMENYTRKYKHQWTVVAPVPYYPRFPFKTFSSYDKFAKVPLYEDPFGYPVHHPRYLIIPKIGMSYYGKWMTYGVRKTIEEIHKKIPIDVIDGHYIYPDGNAAIVIGKQLGIPVVLSARGTDLNLFPQFPSIKSQISQNLKSANHVICVCDALKKNALNLGAVASTISVIGNGIDEKLFYPKESSTCRTELSLPPDKTILLSVGHLVELKGFHLVLEALADMKNTNLVYVIIGEGPEKMRLQQLTEKFGLKGQVMMPGAIRNEKLCSWYNAADYFVLASSREGWPNVVCEAQACGLPVVATKRGGITEIVQNMQQGILFEQRRTYSIQCALETALNKDWDRNYITSIGQQRTWSAVAEQLETVFQAVTS